jgi:hypothetical protein
MARSELELLISVIDQATGELKSIAKGLDGVDTAGKQADKGGLAGFTSGMMDVKAALDIGKQALQGVQQVFQSVLDLASEAGRLERAERAFTNLSGGAEAAAANLEAMKQAAHGTLSEMDAMAGSNKLMAMGLATNAEELEKVATMAIRLGQAFGRDATESIDEFGLLLANQSVLRLDTFGISSGRVRQRIEELMKATKDMTREEAFMIATMEEGEKTMTQLGDYVADSASAVEELQSSWADLKNEWIKEVAPAATNVAKALTLLVTWSDKVAEATSEQRQRIEETIPTYDKYVEAMADLLKASGKITEDGRERIITGERMTEGLERLIRAEGLLTEAEWYGVRATQQGDAALDSWQRSLKAADSALGDTGDSLDETTRRQILMNRAFGDGTLDAEELRTKLLETGDATDDLGKDLDEIKERLATAFDAGIDKLGEYGEANLRAQHAVTLLKLASGELTIEEYKVREATEEVIGQFMDGEITWDTAIGLIQSFGQEAGTAADYLRNEMITSLQGTKSAAEEAFNPVSALKSELGLLAQTPEIKPRFDFSALNDPLSKLREMRRIINELGGAQVKWGGYQVPTDIVIEP